MKTAPTERSNSPQIINSPTPRAMMPRGGIAPHQNPDVRRLQEPEVLGRQQRHDDAQGQEHREHDRHVAGGVMPQPVQRAGAAIAVGPRRAAGLDPCHRPFGRSAGALICRPGPRNRQPGRTSLPDGRPKAKGFGSGAGFGLAGQVLPGKSYR